MNDVLTDRELATVLAALRYWQQDVISRAASEETLLSDHFSDGTTALSAEEIDDLCERLNCQDP